MGKNKKSKSKVTPLDVFLKEFYLRKRSEFFNRKDAVKPALAAWDQLSDEQKARYIAKARARQAEKRADMTNKLDSFGRPVLLMQEQREAEAKREADARMKTFAMVSKALETGKYLEREYTVGHVHLFCTDIGDPAEVDHFPAEIGLATFCLGSGLKTGGFMHDLIDSQPFPAGMMSKAKESKGKHGVDIFTHREFMSKNYQGMRSSVYRVLERLSPEDSSTVYDPIFVRKQEFHSMKQSLRFIFQNAGGNASLDKDLPEILYLEDLVAALRETVFEYCVKVGRVIGKPRTVESYVECLLDSSRFDHDAGTGCPFHEKLGDPSKCSLGYSRQRAMLVMTDLCPLAGQQLIPGRHVPEGYRVETIKTEPS